MYAREKGEIGDSLIGVRGTGIGGSRPTSGTSTFSLVHILMFRVNVQRNVAFFLFRGGLYPYPGNKPEHLREDVGAVSRTSMIRERTGHREF